MNRINAVASTGQSSATLTALLVRVGVEMEDASVSLQAVQNTLADVLPGCLSPQGIIGLQALDLVEQTVRALAKVVISMSNALPNELEIDRESVVANCELSALTERLVRTSAKQSALITEKLCQHDGGDFRQRRQSASTPGSSPASGRTRTAQDVELF